MSGLAIVHLVWAPLGPAPLAGFLRAYRERCSGVDHRLVVVMNGFGPEVDRRPWERLLKSVDGHVIVTGQPVQDLAAYRSALDRVDAEHVVFLNSYARPLVDDWLRPLAVAVAAEDVGLASATGSWESAFSSAPLELRLPRLFQFRRFPNPHLRSNAFGGRVELLRALSWHGPDSKLGALRLESGRRSLTRQVLERGLRAVVVGRDGLLLDPDRWAASRTFRSGNQENLLVADNRTDDYGVADPREQERLGRMAWGDSWVPAA